MIEFTLRAECPKCGNQAFAWSWWLDTSEMPQSRELWAGNPPLVPEEHIRLTCDRCGFAVAMKPKDAA